MNKSKAELSEMGRRNTKQGQRAEYHFVGKLRKIPFFIAEKVKRTASGQKRGDWPDIMAEDIHGISWRIESKKRDNMFAFIKKYLPTHDAMMIHESGHDFPDVVIMKWETFKYLCCPPEPAEKYNARAKHWPKRPLGSKHGRGE